LKTTKYLLKARFNDSDPLKKGLLIFFALMLGVQSAQALETVTYYHHDALGSPVAAADESGNLLWREDYMPYGERVRNPANATDNTLWYTSKPEEPALGLQYFGARWYDTSLGRFTGMDPVKFQEGNIHSFNRYAYANNNPYAYVDPDGREVYGANIGGSFQGILTRFGRSSGSRAYVFDTNTLEFSILNTSEIGVGMSNPSVNRSLFINFLFTTGDMTTDELLGSGVSISGSISRRFGVASAVSAPTTTFPFTIDENNDFVFNKNFSNIGKNQWELGLAIGSGSEVGYTLTDTRLQSRNTTIRDIVDAANDVSKYVGEVRDSIERNNPFNYDRPIFR
jgi:RHS repeat-associated protein